MQNAIHAAAASAAVAILFVWVFAIVNRYDADDAFVFVNAIEESKLA